jgi:hypothetical protein
MISILALLIGFGTFSLYGFAKTGNLPAYGGELLAAPSSWAFTSSNRGTGQGLLTSPSRLRAKAIRRWTNLNHRYAKGSAGFLRPFGEPVAEIAR